MMNIANKRLPGPYAPAAAQALPGQKANTKEQAKDLKVVIWEVDKEHKNKESERGVGEREQSHGKIRYVPA